MALSSVVSAVLAPGQPDSGGWQFFVCATPQTALDGQFTIFGRVVEGMDVVDQLREKDVMTTVVVEAKE